VIDKKIEEAHSIVTRSASPDPIPLDERNFYRFDNGLFQIERLSFLEISNPTTTLKTQKEGVLKRRSRSRSCHNDS